MQPLFPLRIDPNDVLKHPDQWEEIAPWQAFLKYNMIPVVMVTNNGGFRHAQRMTPMGNWGFEHILDPHPRYYSQVGPNHLPSAMGPVPHRMKLSAQGRAKLQVLEGLRFAHKGDTLYKPYKDTGKHPTMGIGHLVTPADAKRGFDEGYTLAQVQDLFTEDIEIRERLLNPQLKMAVSQQQFDALIMFVFNVGGRTAPPYDAIRALNQGGLVTEEDFTRYCHEKDPDHPGRMREVPGLKTRHEAEWQVFSKGAY